ncbi:TetR/AcrR family transcriptional regulator [Streptomyces niveus]|uniref:TetR/AcrR family transcriptional regulator n=1 Tax=Streptomyces niveus TaxID=193462 RepID=UPI0035DCAA70
MPDTRSRILTEAMRLFGELGYTATTISKIEGAAGLSPGSGALYKHFRSKKDILSFGLRERIRKRDALTTLLRTEVPATDPRALLRAVARSGLERLAYERDVNRILVRDLAAFPELLEEFRTAEVARNHAALTQLLQAQATAHATAHPAHDATTGVPDPDWSAVAAILQDALSHYWLMADIYGGVHPTGVTEDAYLDTLTDLALALVPAQLPKEES